MMTVKRHWRGLFSAFAVMAGLLPSNAQSDNLPTMIWLRPMSYGVEVEGVSIVEGPDYHVMQYLSQQMPDFNHSFESYPMKRNWHMVANAHSDQRVYCFFGASVTEARKQWGYYSRPTTVLLPSPVVSLAGALDAHAINNRVSLEQLFAQNLKTVVFDGVVNPWSSAIKALGTPASTYFEMSLAQMDAAEVSVNLLNTRRIDFAFIGTGNREIEEVQTKMGAPLSVYSVVELQGNIRVGNRLLCSKNELGKRATDSLNKALVNILSDPQTNPQFRDLNLNVIGYHPDLHYSFRQHWAELQSSQ